MSTQHNQNYVVDNNEIYGKGITNNKKMLAFCRKCHDNKTGQCKNCSTGLNVMPLIFA